MPTIRFTATPFTVGSWAIVRLPKDASVKLPSRGMSMAEGTLNGSHLTFPLEPDGKSSHWFPLEKSTKKPVTVEMEPKDIKEWPEPTIPADIKKGIAADVKAHAVWKEVTPAAHWDWIRWIRSTNNPDTRAKRIDVACSKLKSGMRRPCCFNRSMCTEPAVSRSGVLLDPTQMK